MTFSGGQCGFVAIRGLFLPRAPRPVPGVTLRERFTDGAAGCLSKSGPGLSGLPVVVGRISGA
jgi:hypothetical protein